jgi:asparagine synthase (glutamine-hydrolysing)
MCGIDGYINPQGVTPRDIKSMNDALRHRGPDDSGVYVSRDRQAGLGHRRLSIIDLAGGQQPIANEDGSKLIVFNGEIYNYQTIRPDLEDKHQFKTKSDTEVILHLYEDLGENCVQKLRGMFAFAIYDEQEQSLFIARDHLGQKPLYYFHDGKRFVFASEIKALLALDPSLRELDPDALYEYLTIRVITSPRSMFRRIRKLPPGHTLTFKNGKIEVKRYWNLSYEPKMDGDFQEILNGLENKMAETVQYHMVSDVPVGAFLSGGMDSSLVVAMMRKASSEAFKTFSGDVPYEDYSELPYAAMVARQYNTDHHELTIKPSLVRTLPDLVFHLDEPSDPLSVCMYYIAELARKEVKVTLGGDGGDELFGGYDRYYGNIYTQYYALLPTAVRRHLLERLLKLVPEGFWYRSVSHQIKWIHQMSFYQGGDRYANSLSYFYFSDDYKRQLYTESFRKTVRGFDPSAGLKAYFDSENAKEAIDKMLYVDQMTRMPDHPVMIQDRMTMAHGLEARAPFLDHKLVEFCAGIPPKMKIKGRTKRFIQVELAKRYLPTALVQKKKQGFSSALPYILADEFKLLHRTFLTRSSLVREGYLKQPAIDRLLYEHLNKKVDHGNRLWLLCNAEVWHRMYIEGQGKDQIKNILQDRSEFSSS